MEEKKKKENRETIRNSKKNSRLKQVDQKKLNSGRVIKYRRDEMRNELGQEINMRQEMFK